MKKNLLTLLIILLSVLCGSSNLSAQEIESSGTWGGIDWTLTTDGTLTIAPTDNEITKVKPWSGEYYQRGEWPAAVNDAITAITGWPYNRSKVKKLIIEEGVTSIGSFTAQSFTNLTGEVVIPSTVTYIGQEAFQKSYMTKLTFAPGGTEKLCIAPGAFKNLKITELILPGDRPEIHIHCWAFNDCTSLEYVVIPANVTDFSSWTHVDYCGMDYVNGNDSQIFTRCWNLETIVFGSEEVRKKFLTAAGNQSNINAIGGVAVALQGPALKASEIGLHHITLSWDAIENAKGYKVYNGEELNPELLTETTFTAYDLDPNTQYCFSVSTVYNTEEESAKSEICVTTLQPVAKVDNTEYGSISAAYNIAQEGETITIINTPTAGKDLFYEVNEINKKVTIDFGAYTYAITVAEGRSLSLGKCTLKLNDNVITNNGTLNLNNVTLIGSGSNIVLKGRVQQQFHILVKSQTANLNITAVSCSTNHQTSQQSLKKTLLASVM